MANAVLFDELGRLSALSGTGGTYKGYG
jgi:hypothetical protein